MNSGLVRLGIFICYSHQDRKHLARAQVHLKPLEHDELIDVWADTRLTSGDWKSQIEKAIAEAKIGILLVSADFYASKFIHETELPQLLRAASEDGMQILPVIINHCRFQRDPDLGIFQAVNDPNSPVAKLPAANREQVWDRVAQSVEAILANRPPEEGWLVVNEKAVLNGLRRLVEGELRECTSDLGGHEEFLIVSFGDYYVRLASDHSNQRLLCEAVSNDCLPAKRQLSNEASNRLLSLGFANPDSDVRLHYYRYFELDQKKCSLPDISALIVQIMAEVYDVGKNAKLDIQFSDLECRS